MNKANKDKLVKWLGGNVVIIALVVLLIVFGTQFFKYIKQFLENFSYDSSVDNIEAPDDIVEDSCLEERTHTTGEFQNYCAKLKSAMGGSWDMTSHDSITSVMEDMKNDCDVSELIRIFGNPPYNEFWYNPTIPLTSWFQKEMSQAKIDEVVNAPLIANGVNFRF